MMDEPLYVDNRFRKSNPKMQSRMNSKAINKILMDSCPDFYEKMHTGVVTGYLEYLRV